MRKHKFPCPRMRRGQLRTIAERKPVIHYPKGHVLFINHEHITRVLNTKAALVIDQIEGEPST